MPVFGYREKCFFLALTIFLAQYRLPLTSYATRQRGSCATAHYLLLARWRAVEASAPLCTSIEPVLEAANCCSLDDRLWQFVPMWDDSLAEEISSQFQSASLGIAFQRVTSCAVWFLVQMWRNSLSWPFLCLTGSCMSQWDLLVVSFFPEKSILVA